MSETFKYTNIKTPGDRTQLLRNKKFKSNDRICPRCQSGYTIDKQMRICRECKGVVLWSRIDDGKFTIKTSDYPYIYHTSVITGITGWYPLDYFIDIKLGEI